MAEKKQSEQEFLDFAQERFKLAAQTESESRRESLDDIEFSIGNQWPQDIKSQRQLDGRPCLTFNQLPQFIRQVTNEQRQQRAAIQVNPIGDGADTDTAEILQGICRHIEVNSHADEAVDIAFDFMVRGGFGCWRVVTDKIHQELETQEIFIRPIDNPFTVYLDPTNKRDPQWAFIIEDLLAGEFKRQFSESRYANGTASLTEYQSVGDDPAAWAQTVDGQEYIRIAEYFTVEKNRGATGKEERSVAWHKISGLDVLDETSWPGLYIPIVKIYGDDILLNGKRHISGLVRPMKDPQRAYNYWMSAGTERIALSPKAPWLMAEGQLPEDPQAQRAWEQSNVRNIVMLKYKAAQVGGTVLPPPQRNIVEPGVQGMMDMIQVARIDLQSTSGLNDANIGRPKPDESGKAVLARQKQGDVATLNFSDNLARGIMYEGKILLDLIPKIYTVPKVQRIIKPDQTIGHVGLFNSKHADQAEAAEALSQDPNISKVYDIGVGQYDVAVSVGPSYQSKRQEAVATQLALLKTDPNLIPVIGDLVVGNMDIPQAKEIAARMKKMLPPQLQDSEDQDPEAALQKLQQQNSALMQQNQILIAHVQDMSMQIKTKAVETQGKVAIEKYKAMTHMSIEQLKIDAEVLIAEINTKAQSAIERAKEFNDVWEQLHGSSHELAMGQQAAQQAQAQQVDAQGHELGMAAVGGAQEQQGQQSDQAHDLGMAAAGAAGQPQGENE